MAKKDLRSITKQFFNDYRVPVLDSAIAINTSMESLGGTRVYKAQDSLPVSTSEEFTYQHELRPYFGKSGVNDQGVGSHPDFAYLKGTGDAIHHYAVTLFIDIKGSTRLNLLMGPQEAAFVKNRILQAAIEVVRSLDGHPHRLMGDALMAYFGGKNKRKEDAVADAINAAAMIRLTMKEHVFPGLDRHLNTPSKLAVRVGVDFGNDQDVLWLSFGFGDASEVTAQGLNVDLASKLQGLAGANNTMMGQSLMSFVDFPQNYQGVKESEGVPVKTLTPNITYADGTSLNYQMRLLQSLNYQRLLPVPTEWKEQVKDLSRVKSCSDVEYKCSAYEDGEWSHYPSISRFLDKGLSLRFSVKVPSYFVTSQGGLEVVFTKQNHGEEAGDETQEITRTEWMSCQRGGRNGAPPPYQSATIDEGTQYRGLHTMNVKVFSRRSPRTLLFEDWIGVYIV